VAQRFHREDGEAAEQDHGSDEDVQTMCDRQQLD